MCANTNKRDASRQSITLILMSYMLAQTDRGKGE